MLALLCSGVVYGLYFGLIADVGPANAIAVTFLTPVFAAPRGWVFLGEGLMLQTYAVILVGTGLTTGWLNAGRVRRVPGSIRE